MGERIKEKTIMKKLEQWQIEKKLLGEYCGLTFIGIGEEDEVEFIGNKKQWEDYEIMKDMEVYYNEDSRPYLMWEDEEDSKTYLD